MPSCSQAGMHACSQASMQALPLSCAGCALNIRCMLLALVLLLQACGEHIFHAGSSAVPDALQPCQVRSSSSSCAGGDDSCASTRR